LVDVTGIEPATPCLQSREEKTLKCFDGVAYTENQRNSRSSNVPKLSRSAATGVSLHGKSTEILLPKCPEVVPNIGAPNAERAVCRFDSSRPNPPWKSLVSGLVGLIRIRRHSPPLVLRIL